MTPTMYLAKLLALCTPAQLKIYDRMYPLGAEGDATVAQAITKIENTIGALNCKNEQFKQLKLDMYELEVMSNQKNRVSSATIAELEAKLEAVEHQLRSEMDTNWKDQLIQHIKNI